MARYAIRLWETRSDEYTGWFRYGEGHIPFTAATCVNDRIRPLHDFFPEVRRKGQPKSGIGGQPKTQVELILSPFPGMHVQKHFIFTGR
jgi:hypothetical protein